jgi:IS30 family transposase
MNKNKKKHLSNQERFCIERMIGVGHTTTHIAKTLGRGVSTISEEISSNGGRKKYNAEKAIHRAYLKQYRKKRNCNKVAMDGHLLRFVEEKLRAGWSPETISCRLKIQSGLKYVSPKSIRKFIKKRSGLERFLFWKRNNHKSGKKRGSTLFLIDRERKWIDIRPPEACTEYGHWEMDFIVSKHNSSVLLVCVEKQSRLMKIMMLPNRKKETVSYALNTLLHGYTVHSITTDNDVAFSHWKDLEVLLNTSIYFCHPYHSWEKGLVENCNRWTREFISKKTNLQLVSSGYVSNIESYFNNKPRECLGGYTACEISSMKEKKTYGMMVSVLSVSFPDIRIWG